MRFAVVPVVFCLVLSSAHADKRRKAAPPAPASGAPAPAAPPAPVADDDAAAAAASARARSLVDDVGQRREIVIVAPTPVAVATDDATADEHRVADAPAARADAAPAELAARQMRRHQPALDASAAAAAKRGAHAAGTVTLAFTVADRKVAHVDVADDGVHDPALARCLTAAAARFTFSLAAARFRWPVTLAPVATVPSAH
jgi:type IV secretory pathway VirB10-like protein